MWQLRYLKESLLNLFRWLPVIWQDRQWDNSFMEKILLQKIFMMRKYHEKRQFFEGWEIEVKWMMICEGLLTDLTESRYWLDEYDDKPLNLRNIDCPQEWKDLITTNPGWKCDLREIKARHLLYKILAHKSPHWWN